MRKVQLWVSQLIDPDDDGAMFRRAPEDLGEFDVRVYSADETVTAREVAADVLDHYRFHNKNYKVRVMPVPLKPVEWDEYELEPGEVRHVKHVKAVST